MLQESNTSFTILRCHTKMELGERKRKLEVRRERLTLICVVKKEKRFLILFPKVASKEMQDRRFVTMFALEK